MRSRLYMRQVLRDRILEQCHEAVDHIKIDKTYEIISRKYYRPRLYKQVTAYVNSCIIRYTRSSKYAAAPLTEMDVPAYPFEKICQDMPDPYGETPQGNIYIVSFVDCLTNFSETYAKADKNA